MIAVILVDENDKTSYAKAKIYVENMDELARLKDLMDSLRNMSQHNIGVYIK